VRVKVYRLLKKNILGYREVLVNSVNEDECIGLLMFFKGKLENKELSLDYVYDEVIIEKYISGKELTVGILGKKTLPPIEIIPKVSNFYDYRAKYLPKGSEHIVPADIPKDVERKVRSIALKAFRCIGGKVVGRVDMKWDGSNVYVLEINTIPGMTKTSLLPESAKACGISFEDLVEKILIYSIKERNNERTFIPKKKI